MSTPDWDGFNESARRNDEVASVKAERDRLARQLHETKHKQADYLATVREAVQEAVSRIELAPVPSWHELQFKR